VQRTRCCAQTEQHRRWVAFIGVLIRYEAASITYTVAEAEVLNPCV